MIATKTMAIALVLTVLKTQIVLKTLLLQEALVKNFIIITMHSCMVMIQSDYTFIGDFMNIYISKHLSEIYFFNNTVTLPFETSIEKHNIGLSYLLYCIGNGVNDVNTLAISLIDKFCLKDDLPSVVETILFNTVKNEELKKAFTTDIHEANLCPKINGIYGKKYPQILHVELTGTCNYMCSHCYKNASNNGKNLDFNFLNQKIYKEFKGFIPFIHFTGGEPTLHEDFGKIVDLFKEGYTLQLTTNGSQITSYPIDVFKNFQAIDISLYGLSQAEYKVNTGNANAFNWVTKGCNFLASANIDFRVTLVINNDNCHHIEDYVKYGINVGANSIAFALPTYSGKLLNDKTDKWYLTKEKRKIIYRQIRDVQKRYNHRIAIRDWSRTIYSDMWKSYPADDSLRCGGGKRDWWMSEHCLFRPCSFLPNEYLNLEYDTWYKYINNEQNIDWTQARTSLELFAAEHNFNIIDICPIFKK